MVDTLDRWVSSLTVASLSNKARTPADPRRHRQWPRRPDHHVTKLQAARMGNRGSARQSGDLHLRLVDHALSSHEEFSRGESKGGDIEMHIVGSIAIETRSVRLFCVYSNIIWFK